MNLSRRSLLSLGAAGVASTAIPFTFAGQNGKWKGKRPKNIIFMVADGMSHQTVAICDEYQKLALGKPCSQASKPFWMCVSIRKDSSF